MGQGVVTSLAQMAADELGVSLDSDRHGHGRHGPLPVRHGHVRLDVDPLLRPGAAGRRGRGEGRPRSSSPPSSSRRRRTALRVEDGVVFLGRGPKARVTFGQLAKGQKIVRKLDGKAVTKSVSEFRVMGKADEAPRRAREGDRQGRSTPATSACPGCSTRRSSARRRTAPTLKSVDTSAAARSPGVRRRQRGRPGRRAAPDPEAAEKALAAVKAECDVPEPAFDDQTIFDHLLEVAAQGEEREKKGTSPRARRPPPRSSRTST